jgi:hypothetical protein
MATDLTTRHDEPAKSAPRAHLPRSGYIQKSGVSRAAAPPQVNETRGRTPKAFHNQLFPDVFLVVIDAVFSQQPKKLMLKRFRAMMLFLIPNALFQAIQVRRTHRERSVSTLPLKCVKVWGLGLQPFGRIAFEFANQLGRRARLAELAKNVDVVLDTAHEQGRRVLLAAGANEIPVEAGSDFFVPQERFSVAGREDKVKVNLRERLSHGEASLWNAFGVHGVRAGFLGWRRCAADLRLLNVTASRYLRLTSRWLNAALVDRVTDVAAPPFVAGRQEV